MARYRLAHTWVGAPLGPASYGKYLGGITIADTVGNAVAGDIVSATLTTSPDRNLLVPLDAAAATAIGGTIGVYAPAAGYPYPGIASGADGAVA